MNYKKYSEQIELSFRSRNNSSLEFNLNGSRVNNILISFSIDSYTLNPLNNENVTAKSGTIESKVE